MTSASRLYDASSHYLSQYEIQWQDARHLQTLDLLQISEKLEPETIFWSSFRLEDQSHHNQIELKIISSKYLRV